MKMAQIGGAIFLPPIFLPFTERQPQRVVSAQIIGVRVFGVRNVPGRHVSVAKR